MNSSLVFDYLNLNCYTDRSLSGVVNNRIFRLSESELSDIRSGLRPSVFRAFDLRDFDFIIGTSNTTFVIPLLNAVCCLSTVAFSLLSFFAFASLFLWRLFINAPHFVSRCVPSIDMFDKNAIAAKRRRWRALLNAFEFDILICVAVLIRWFLLFRIV